MVYHGIPWYTTIYHGIPSYTWLGATQRTGAAQADKVGTHVPTASIASCRCDAVHEPQRSSCARRAPPRWAAALPEAASIRRAQAERARALRLERTLERLSASAGRTNGPVGSAPQHTPRPQVSARTHARMRMHARTYARAYL